MAIQNAWIKVREGLTKAIDCHFCNSFLSSLPSPQPCKFTWTSTCCGRLVRRTCWTFDCLVSGRRICDAACPAVERLRRRVRSTLTVSSDWGMMAETELCVCPRTAWDAVFIVLVSKRMTVGTRNNLLKLFQRSDAMSVASFTNPWILPWFF